MPMLVATLAVRGLYAKINDKPLIISHIVSLAVFVVAAALFTRFTTELVVPLGLIMAFSFILCWKALQFYRLTPANWR